MKSYDRHIYILNTVTNYTPTTKRSFNMNATKHEYRSTCQKWDPLFVEKHPLCPKLHWQCVFFHVKYFASYLLHIFTQSYLRWTGVVQEKIWDVKISETIVYHRFHHFCPLLGQFHDFAQKRIWQVFENFRMIEFWWL